MTTYWVIVTLAVNLSRRYTIDCDSIRTTFIDGITSLQFDCQASGSSNNFFYSFLLDGIAGLAWGHVAEFKDYVVGTPLSQDGDPFILWIYREFLINYPHFICLSNTSDKRCQLARQSSLKISGWDP